MNAEPNEEQLEAYEINERPRIVITRDSVIIHSAEQGPENLPPELMEMAAELVEYLRHGPDEE
jgi:hypothetical protein